MLELTAEEQVVLLEILGEQGHELTFEISRTENNEFRAGLVHRSEILDAVYKKVDTFRAASGSVQTELTVA